MNIMFLSGRLVKDPEIRYTKSNVAVASFVIATNEGKDKDGNQITEFVRCTAFKRTAELIDQYCLKGSPVILQGRFHTNVWEDKDGKKHYDTECQVHKVEFQSGKERVVNARDVEPSSDEYEELEGGELPF